MNFSRSKSILLIASLAVIAWSLVSIFQRKKPTQTTGMITTQGLADAAADELGKIAGSHPTLLLIHGPSNDMTPPEVSGFPDQLSRTLQQRGMRVIGNELADTATPDTVLLSWDDFAGALGKHPDADVVVSLIGPPNVTPQASGNWAAIKPKLVVVRHDFYPRPPSEALNSEYLGFAIIARDDVKVDGKHPPKTPGEWFNTVYRVITPATVRK